MGLHNEVEQRIRQRLIQFLTSAGDENPVFSEQTDLIRNFGLSSDQGLDFVLELCDEFEVELPMDFNPFVDATGRRALKFGEMVRAVESFLPKQEVAHDSK